MSGLGAYYQAKSLGMSDGWATSAMIQEQNREREARGKSKKLELLEVQAAKAKASLNEFDARLKESFLKEQELKRRLAQDKAREVEQESRRRAEAVRQKEKQLAHLEGLLAESEESTRQKEFNKLTGQIESLLKELQAKHA